MLKVLKQFVLAFGLMLIALSIPTLPLTFAAGLLPLPDSSNYGNLPAPNANGSAEQQFSQLVLGIAQNVRYIIGAVAIALIVYSGIRMVIASGNEDVYTKQRQHILWAIIGLALVGMSGEIARIFQVACDPKLASGTCTPGGFLSDPNAIIRQSTLFNQRTQFLIVFIKYFIGSVAVLEIVVSGMKMISMGEQEDKMTLVKKNLAYGVLGLLLIIIADSAISKVFFKLDPTAYSSVSGAQPGVDINEGIKQIVAVTNIIVSIVSPIAVLAILAAGVMYITSAGNEEKQGKAKRLIFAVVIGIIIMYGAFALVSTFIGGRFEGGSGPVTQPTGSSINPS